MPKRPLSETRMLYDLNRQTQKKRSVTKATLAKDRIEKHFFPVPECLTLKIS